MPLYNLEPEWSAPIALQAGDILQNRGAQVVEIHPGNPAEDDAALRLPVQGGAMLIERPATIRARSIGDISILSVVRGF